MSENTNNAAPAAPVVETEATETVENSQESQENQEVEATPEEKSVEQKKIEKKLKKLKLKVDGEEFEEEFDPNDDAYLTRQFQLAKASQKRMSQYADLEKELIDFMQELKTNPKKALTKDFIGLDLKKLATEIIDEEIERAQKSPEQLEKEKLQAELQAIKEEREREKQEAQAAELERRREQEAERYDILMEKALNESNLPKTPYTVKKMAELMLIGLENGIDLTPTELVPLVREEMEADIKQMFAVMPEDVIEQFIGKDVFNRVRKKNLAKAKAAPAAPLKTVKEVSKEAQKKEQAVVKKTFKDFFGTGV